MPTDKPWEDAPLVEDAAPWNAAPLAEASTPPPESTWEKVQQAATGLVGNIGSGLSGFVKELPLVGLRAASLPADIISGGMEKVADVTGLSQNPTVARVMIEKARREYELRKKLEAPFAEDPYATTAEKVGRGAARMAPQAALAAVTGGASLPIQGAVQGGAQALQSISEGASPESAALSGGMAALGPAAGAALNAPLSWIKAPFKKWVDPAALQAFERAGVEAPASAVTKSPVARNVETLMGKLIGGQQITNRAEKAAQELNAAAGGLGGAANATKGGVMTAEDYAVAREAARALKNAEYAKVGNLTEIPAVPEGTLAEIDRMIAEGTAAPDVLARLKGLRTAIAPDEEAAKAALAAAEKARYGQYVDDPQVRAIIDQSLGTPAPVQAQATPRSAADLMSQQAGLEYGGPNALSDAALSNKLRESLGGDINRILAEASPEQRAQLETAKAAYGRYADLTKSTLGKTVSRLSEQPDKIVESVVSPAASVQDLRRVMQIARPETIDQIRQNVLADIVGGSRGAEVRLTPEKIASAIKRWKPERLREILTPEQYGRLQDLVTTSRAMGRAAKISEGSQTTPWLKTAEYIGAPQAIIAALLTGNPLGAAGIGLGIGGQAAAARAIGSKAGQRWLTTGFGPATLPGRFLQGAGVATSRIPSEVEMERRKQALLAALAGQ